MNIDYHALLPINGKKFSGGHLTAVVVNIPGPTQDSNNVLYLTRFEGTTARRMLNLWVAEETLRLNPNAHRDVFKAVDEWLKTDEGHSDAPHRFFDETQQALVPYLPGTGPLRREESVSDDDRLSLLLDGVKPNDAAAIRAAWNIQDDSRIDVLLDLAQELAPAQAEVIYLELLERILKAPSVPYRRDKISQLVPHLSDSLLSTLVEGLKKENNEDDRNRLFDFVLPRLPLPQLRSLVSYAKTWGIQGARNLFLARLAENLADKGDVEQAFAIADM